MAESLLHMKTTILQSQAYTFITPSFLGLHVILPHKTAETQLVMDFHCALFVYLLFIPVPELDPDCIPSDCDDIHFMCRLQQET